MSTEGEQKKPDAIDSGAAAAAALSAPPPLVPQQANYGWREHPQYYAHPNNSLARVTLNVTERPGMDDRHTFTTPECKFKLQLITPVLRILWPQFYPCGDFKGDWPNSKFGATSEHLARNKALLSCAAWDPAYRTPEGLDPYAAHMMEYIRLLGKWYFHYVAYDDRLRRKALDLFYKDQVKAATSGPVKKKPPTRAESDKLWWDSGVDEPIKYKYNPVTLEVDPESYAFKLDSKLFTTLTAKAAAFASSRPRGYPSKRIADVCAPYVPSATATPEEQARAAPHGRLHNGVELHWMATQTVVPFDQRRAVLTHQSLVSVALTVDASLSLGGRPRIQLEPKGTFLYRRAAETEQDAQPLKQAHSFPGAEGPPAELAALSAAPPAQEPAVAVAQEPTSEELWAAAEAAEVEAEAQHELQQQQQQASPARSSTGKQLHARAQRPTPY